MAAATGLQKDQPFPEGVKFKYVPWTTSDVKVCGIPVVYEASKEFQNKKVVLVSVPGAFTPTCSANHVPPFIQRISELKAKGVDNLIILAHNDPYVMSGWQKVNVGGTEDDNTFVLFMADVETQLAQKIGWTAGERNARFAAVIDHGKVTYAAREAATSDLTVSSADAVIAAL